MDLQEIEAIKQLKYRYVRALDSADLETLGMCFVRDAAIRFEGGLYTAELAGREEIKAAMAEAFHNKVASSHLLHHPVITLTTATSAAGQWTLRDTFYDLHHGALISGVAEYEDSYVKEEDGAWRMQHSAYTRLYETAQPLPPELNFTARKLSETGRDIGLETR